jgi:hypothetical protein
MCLCYFFKSINVSISSTVIIICVAMTWIVSCKYVNQILFNGSIYVFFFYLKCTLNSFPSSFLLLLFFYLQNKMYIWILSHAVMVRPAVWSIHYWQRNTQNVLQYMSSETWMKFEIRWENHFLIFACPLYLKLISFNTRARVKIWTSINLHNVITAMAFEI